MADKYFNFKPQRSHSGIVKKFATPTGAIGAASGAAHLGGDASGPAGVFTNLTLSHSYGVVNPLVGAAGAVVGIQMAQEQLQISFTFEPRSLGTAGTITDAEAKSAILRAGDVISLHYVTGASNDAGALAGGAATAHDADPAAAATFHVTDVTETLSLSDNRQFSVNAIQYEGGGFVQLS